MSALEKKQTMKHTSTIHLGYAVALAGFLLHGVVHSQHPVQVTITELPLLPGGTSSSAHAISDSGRIVGLANDATGATKVVQWVNGQISILADLSTGSGLPVPEDANLAGECVGTQSINGGTFSYAVNWTAPGAVGTLPGLQGGLGSMAKAHGINALGQIAGMARENTPPNYYPHAVVWQQGALQTDLGLMPGSLYTEALGINDLGAVVGVATLTSFAPHAFLWSNGQYTDPSTWVGGGAVSKALAINHHGDVVGMNANVAALWRNGAVQALPMPPGLSAFTSVVDINDAGDMIATAGPPFEVGVLWRNGAPIQLGTLPGGTISRARRVNSAGVIVGDAQSASLFYRAVMWTVSTPAVAMCPGDGTVLPCPCANEGAAGHGCGNSVFASGAVLSSTGQASVLADSLRLSATGVTGSFAVFYQGTAAAAPVVLDDGIGCVGGVIRRLATVPVAAASSAYPEAGQVSISVRGAIPATGGTHEYQCFYRNAAGLFCPPATSNRTNGLSIVWTP